MSAWTLLHSFSSTDQKIDTLNTVASAFYNDETDFSGLPDWAKPASNGIDYVANYITPAITLAQWIRAQQIGWTGPGETPENPYIVQVDQTNRQEIVEKLGFDPSPPELIKDYDRETRFHPSLRNTFFNLAGGELGGVRWDKESDELVFFDRYNFEGIGDFGLASAGSDHSGVRAVWEFVKCVAVSVSTFPFSSGKALFRQVVVALGFNPSTGKFADGQSLSDFDSLPFTTFKQGNFQIGNVRNLYIEFRITAEELCDHNPVLYRAAVAKGYLEFRSDIAGSCSKVDERSLCFDAIGNVIPVGQAQPMALLGFPYYPPNVSQMYSMSTYNFGLNNKYPSPFTSYIQQTFNTANLLGAYAMWGPIAGRLKIIQGGANSGEIGFIAQCWDDFDDGPNNVDGDGIQYPSKLEWWNTCEYEIMTVKNLLFAEQPPSDVTVAIKSFNGPGDDDVWRPSWQPSASPFGTVELGALVGLAALTGRYLR